MATTRTNRHEPLPRCPAAEHIRVVQAQLFDNGEKPGKGKKHHVVVLEVYCENRLNLYKPYWKRAVPLTTPDRFMRRVETQYDAGALSEAQYATYHEAAATMRGLSEDPEVEFAKMGHIGSTPDHCYYPGQFILMIKITGKALALVINLDEHQIPTESFQYNNNWKKGAKSNPRKFVGFYDPSDLYGAMKAEQAQIAEANARASLY